jgi:hypothetical protein
MSSLNCISKKVAEAPKIDFGDLFNESVLVFKKVWLQGFILQLLSIGLSLPLMFLNFSMFQGHKKWGITFAITFLNIISLYVLIMLTCGLGALFFSCFLQMPIYVLYKKIISFESLENQL